MESPASKPSVQTFRARSPREALEQIKRVLGPDAVILGTRNVPGRGVGPLSGRPWVEITAAPPGTASLAPRIRPRTPPTIVAPTVPAAPEAPAAAPQPDVPPHLFPCYVQLVQSEVAEELARHLVQQAALRMQRTHEDAAAAVRGAVCQYIAQMLPPDDGVDMKQRAPRRVAFVGPSGGGKTTTVAKLAARYQLQEGRSVALLSLDMQHVGAHEQLRRYAEILDVPLHVAQTIVDVKRALKTLVDLDVVLIDTPGVGLREHALFARLATLLRAARAEQTQLVLPASLAPPILARMGQGFAPLQPDGLVLTRLDDVVGFGVILNVIDMLHLRMSFLSTGQNVPHDIEAACSQRIAELVLPPSQRAADVKVVQG